MKILKQKLNRGAEKNKCRIVITLNKKNRKVNRSSNQKDRKMTNNKPNRIQLKTIDKNNSTSKIPRKGIVKTAGAKNSSKLKGIKLLEKLRCSINQRNIAHSQRRLIIVGKMASRIKVEVEEVAEMNGIRQIVIRIMSIDRRKIKVNVAMKLEIKILIIDRPIIKTKEATVMKDIKQIVSRTQIISRQKIRVPVMLMIPEVRIHTTDHPTIRIKKGEATENLDSKEDKMMGIITKTDIEEEVQIDKVEVVEGDIATIISEKSPTKTETTQQKTH